MSCGLRLGKPNNRRCAALVRLRQHSVALQNLQSKEEKPRSVQVHTGARRPSLSRSAGKSENKKAVEWFPVTTVRIYGLSKDPEPEPLHEYSSIQVQIVGKPADLMSKMATAIPDADLVPDGREHEFHITCKWGLHFQSPTIRLRNALKDFGPVKATLGKTSLFRNDDADVLKVDVSRRMTHTRRTSHTAPYVI